MCAMRYESHGRFVERADKHEEAYRSRIRVFDPLARFAATRVDAAASPESTIDYVEQQRQANFEKTKNAWKTARHTPPDGPGHPRTRSTMPNTGEDHHLPPSHFGRGEPAFGGGNQGSAGGDFGVPGMGDDDESTNDARAAMFQRQQDAYKQPSRRDLRRGIAR